MLCVQTHETCVTLRARDKLHFLHVCIVSFVLRHILLYHRYEYKHTGTCRSRRGNFLLGARVFHTASVSSRGYSLTAATPRRRRRGREPRTRATTSTGERHHTCEQTYKRQCVSAAFTMNARARVCALLAPPRTPSPAHNTPNTQDARALLPTTYRSVFNLREYALAFVGFKRHGAMAHSLCLRDDLRVLLACS